MRPLLCVFREGQAKGQLCRHTSTDQAQTQHVRRWNNVLQPSCFHSNWFSGWYMAPCLLCSLTACSHTVDIRRSVPSLALLWIDRKQQTVENSGTHNVPFWFGERCCAWDAEVLFSKRWGDLFLNLKKRETTCWKDTYIQYKVCHILK